MAHEIRVFKDAEAVAQQAAQLFVEEFKVAVTRSGRFKVVLSGGHTPIKTYELLTREPYLSQIEWSQVHLFWGDERCVPFDDSRSNYKEVQETLLSKIPIPEVQVRPIFFNQNASQAAADYETTLKAYFDSLPPLFDFIFLGLGLDGHTASLFPGSVALQEDKKWAVSVQNETDDFARITLAPWLLNQTHRAVFLVTGLEKAPILKKVLEAGPYTGKGALSYPAQLIQPTEGGLTWMVDSLASS
jgi:6-phosphogluconolactonase